MLGQGGFGITYHVTGEVRVGNITVRTSFAMKEFFPSEMCERDASTRQMVYSGSQAGRLEDAKRSFVTEATRLQRLGIRHRNIVGINEVFKANGTVYYVMEYIDGPSLSEHVNSKGCLSEDETRMLLRPVLDAVRILHSSRTTHLDIKPANIMLQHTDDGGLRPVLIDFGLTKHYNDDGSPTTRLNMIACSAGFAPAEQYAGITEFSPMADIYALAATVMYCLTGAIPPNAFEITDHIIRHNLAGRASETCAEAICRSMRLDRTQRDSTLLCVWFGSNESNPIRQSVSKNRNTEQGKQSKSTKTHRQKDSNKSPNASVSKDYWELEQLKKKVEGYISTGLYREAYDECLENVRLNRNLDYCRGIMEQLRHKIRKQAKLSGLMRFWVFLFGAMLLAVVYVFIRAMFR